MGNFIKISLRNLLKSRTFSIINLAGLSMGLACFILIALWINRELSVDGFHENRDRLFRVLENQTYSGNEIFTFAATPGPLRDMLKQKFPEITHASRATWGDRSLISFGDQSFFEEGFYVDPDFIPMFNLSFLRGDAKTALAAPNEILLSERIAQKYFGAADPLEKTLKLDDADEYVVKGIFRDMPENSTLEFDFLVPLDNHIKRNDWLQTWNSNGIRLFLMTQPGVKAEALSAKIKNTVRENSEQDNVDLWVQAAADWYLRSDFKDGKYTGGGRIEYVRLFGIIALFILLIACINFMNLSTAKSASRALEVGIRKVSGATRRVLSAQFLSESLVLSLIAGILGIGLTKLALPYFNRLFELELSLGQAGAGFWAAIVGVMFLTGVIAGSYPALFLSGFQPVKVLKGSTKTGTGGGSALLRKVLVTAQFMISVFLIVSTLVIFRQTEFIRTKRLGYDKENLLYFPANGALPEKYETVKAELLQLPGIASVSYTSGWIHSWGNNTSGVSWPGKEPDQSILFQTIPTGYDFLKTIGATLKDGRDFSPDFPGDSLAYIVNERAASLMGMDNPVGQQLTLNETKGPIIGVVNDFHVGTFRNNQDPVILALRPYNFFIYARLRPGDQAAALASIGNVLKKHNPAYPFEYHFTDQEYEQLHQGEKRMGALSRVFAFLAIFVSCLGLFGLAIFSTEQRTKEIGIRKVMGATVMDLVSLFSGNFLKLVGIAFLLGAPLAWWATTNWLENFAFRIDMGWRFFLPLALGAGGLAALIAFLTVGSQSIKAALANPVKSLRNE